MKKINTKYKIVTAFILGGILTSSVVYAATVLGASSVSYNNSSSKLSSTTVQGAIDEIYNNATGGDIIYNNKNIVGAYLYDPDKCTTGNEVSCKKTNCPNDTSKNTCPSGTIIKYKVNESTTKTFNVLYGDRTTLTLQDSTNTLSEVAWYSGADDNSKGPTTALQALESVAEGWNNVNTMEYTMGTTIFKINANTGCDDYGNCTTSKYTLGARSGKVRMITGQEAASVGCSNKNNSCPSWMGTDEFYWTMSAHSSHPGAALFVSANSNNGLLYSLNTTITNCGARAVVVISK